MNKKDRTQAQQYQIKASKNIELKRLHEKHKQLYNSLVFALTPGLNEPPLNEQQRTLLDSLLKTNRMIAWNEIKIVTDLVFKDLQKEKKTMIKFRWLPEGIESVEFIYPEGYKVTVISFPNKFKHFIQQIFS
jgi:hypothetical protein